MIARRRRRSGASLLEAIVALSILAVAGVGAVKAVEAAARAVAAAQITDEEMARASAFFDAVSLWPVGDLDRRLGTRRQGDWRLYIETSGSIYTLVLLDSTGQRRLLETALHRPLRRNPSTNAP